MITNKQNFKTHCFILLSLFSAPLMPAETGNEENRKESSEDDDPWLKVINLGPPENPQHSGFGRPPVFQQHHSKPEPLRAPHTARPPVHASVIWNVPRVPAAQPTFSVDDSSEEDEETANAANLNGKFANSFKMYSHRRWVMSP